MPPTKFQFQVCRKGNACPPNLDPDNTRTPAGLNITTCKLPLSHLAMSSSTEPTFWYKILDQPPPSPLPEILPATDLDANDGFIHLSTGSQIPITAGLFFSNHQSIWVLKLRREDIDGRVEYPPELGKCCPHVFDSKGLGKDNVEEVIELKRGEGQKWAEVPGMSQLHD